MKRTNVWLAATAVVLVFTAARSMPPSTAKQPGKEVLNPTRSECEDLFKAFTRGADYRRVLRLARGVKREATPQLKNWSRAFIKVLKFCRSVSHKTTTLRKEVAIGIKMSERGCQSLCNLGCGLTNAACAVVLTWATGGALVVQAVTYCTVFGVTCGEVCPSVTCANRKTNSEGDGKKNCALKKCGGKGSLVCVTSKASVCRQFRGRNVGYQCTCARTCDGCPYSRVRLSNPDASSCSKCCEPKCRLLR